MKGGNAPNVAVALSTDMFTLIDEDAIAPFDEAAGKDAKAWERGDLAEVG